MSAPTSEAEAAIQVRGLTKRYGRVAALRGIDLEVWPGERLALFGPNGSGKTTLLKVLAGLLPPTRGSLHIVGLDYRHAGQHIRRRTGVLSHHPYLYEELSAQENLLFYGRMYGLKDLSSRVEEALGKAGMERRRHDKVRTLSRGMQQRLGLARATLHDPEVLLLDEPDTGLDQEAAAHIPLFLERKSGLPRTVILATHDLRFGIGQCERFLILTEGRVAYQGTRAEGHPETLEELYRSHASAN